MGRGDGGDQITVAKLGLSFILHSKSSLKSVAGIIIQATGRTEFADSLRQGSLGYLWCETYVAIGEVWENPICLRELLVHLDLPTSCSNGISSQ